MSPEEMFAKNKNLKEYHQTSDGNKFHDPLIAKTHAKGLKEKNVTAYYRKNHIGKKNTVTSLSAEQRVEVVKKMKTIEAVEIALTDEKAKTVLAAGAERIEELTLDSTDSTDESSQADTGSVE